MTSDFTEDHGAGLNGAGQDGAGLHAAGEDGAGLNGAGAAPDNGAVDREAIIAAASSTPWLGIAAKLCVASAATGLTASAKRGVGLKG